MCIEMEEQAESFNQYLLISNTPHLNQRVFWVDVEEAFWKINKIQMLTDIEQLIQLGIFPKNQNVRKIGNDSYPNLLFICYVYQAR